MNNHNPAPSSSSSSPSSSPLSSSSSTSSVNTEFSSILSPSSSSPSSSSSSAICNPNGEQRKAFESFDLSEPNSNSFDALAEEVVKDNSDEIGRIAFWSVSSAKPGLDVDNLRDGNVMTFWQSDSEPPHHISIQFQRLTTSLSFLIDRDLDDSYCPSEVEVYAGTIQSDLQYVCGYSIPSNASGWVTVPLYESKVMEKKDVRGVAGFYFRLVITENFKGGKDTHIRQFLVLGPRSNSTQLSQSISSQNKNVYDGIR